MNTRRVNRAEGSSEEAMPWAETAGATLCAQPVPARAVVATLKESRAEDAAAIIYAMLP